MPDYLITVTSSAYRLLRATTHVTTPGPVELRNHAHDFLRSIRATYIGGHDWDTWTATQQDTGQSTPPVVARGTWDSD